MTEAERLAEALDVCEISKTGMSKAAAELRRLLSESLRIEELHAQAKRELFDAIQLNKELVEALESISQMYHYETNVGELASRLYEAKCISNSALEKAKQ